jgi:hypothetical protein
MMGTALFAKAKGGARHWLAQDLPDLIGGLTEPVKVSAPSQGSVLVFALRDAQGESSPGVVARRCGKGRAVYLAGWSSEFAFTQLLRRVMFWAAGKEGLWTRLSVSGAEDVFVYAYPQVKMVALLNNRSTSAQVIMRCDPAIFNVQPGVSCRLVDGATHETLWKGSARELARGLRVTAVGNCVRFLRLSFHADGQE